MTTREDREAAASELRRSWQYTDAGSLAAWVVSGDDSAHLGLPAALFSLARLLSAHRERAVAEERAKVVAFLRIADHSMVLKIAARDIDRGEHDKVAQP